MLARKKLTNSVTGLKMKLAMPKELKRSNNILHRICFSYITLKVMLAKILLLRIVFSPHKNWTKRLPYLLFIEKKPLLPKEKNVLPHKVRKPKKRNYLNPNLKKLKSATLNGKLNRKRKTNLNSTSA